MTGVWVNDEMPDDECAGCGHERQYHRTFGCNAYLCTCEEMQDSDEPAEQTGPGLFDTP